MIESKIVRSGDRFVIEIEGRRIAPIAYMSYQPDVADYARFTAAGFELLFVSVYASDRGINPHSSLRPMRPGFWTGEDRFDFSAVDEDFRIAVQGRAPGEAYIIPRVMLEVPPWWKKAHPEELCRDFSGASLHQSFSSEKWFADAERVMARFQDWLAESGWDRYVAGWHLAAGSTQEFLRPHSHDSHYIDYSEPSKRAYRRWLSERYEGDIQRLNAAWGAQYAAFEEIQPATPAERRYQTDTPRARFLSLLSCGDRHGRRAAVRGLQARVRRSSDRRRVLRLHGQRHRRGASRCGRRARLAGGRFSRQPLLL